jgi:Tfp pilus assembly protein FimV
VVTPSPTIVPTATPTAKPTPKPTATPTAKPTPKPTAKPTPKPASNRYKLLKACPDKAGCWIYTVHSGDNLFSIAKYFGHSLKTIYTWNPQYPATRLRVGAQIRMPAPTR